jgi:DNA-directed RNA polymerase specialized sigma24 family protein
VVSPRVILRADFEDGPSHKIAADFGLTENRTAHLLFRARRSLESALDERA